jgi:hypothetical protein
MRRRLGVLLAGSVLLGTLGIAGVASAANTKGPYDGASADSGTCGNDWANDTYKRKFTVSDDGAGNFTLREDYIAGKFVTVAGVSPGACDILPGPTGNGHVVTAGVKGEFNGYVVGPVTGGTYNPDATCADPCTGTTYVAAFFGLTAVWTTPTFDFDYHANGAGKLLFSRWQNASADQGGNVGDIATN